MCTNKKCTVNVMCLNHPQAILPLPHPQKNCLPQNRSVMTKMLQTTTDTPPVNRGF